MVWFNRFLILTLILFFSTVAFAGDGPGRSDRRSLKKGVSAYEKGDYEAAREYLEKAIDGYPAYAEAWYTLGRVALAEKKAQQAFGYFKKAVEQDPDHEAAQLELGRMLMAARMPEEAIVRADAILKRDPHHLEAILLKGSALMSQKRSDEAISLLDPVYERGERTQNLILLLASAYFRQGNAERTEALLKAGIEKHPDAVALRLQQSNFYLRRGQLEKARTAMEKVVADAPDNFNYAIALARLYWETQTVEKAERLLSQTLSAAPDDVARRIAIANFYLEKKKDTQAGKILRDGMAGEDPSASLRLALGELLIKRGDADGAVALLKEGLDAAKDGSDAKTTNIRNALAKIYLAARDPATAKTYVDRVLESTPDNLQALVIRGQILKATGQPQAAIADFTRVLHRKPDFIDGYIQLADAHLLNRQIDQAGQTLAQGLRLAPDNRTLLMSAYRVSLKAKDYKQAEAHLTHLVETDPQAIDVQAELGDFYMLLNDESSARREYSEIVLKSPHATLGYLRLARLYRRQGKIDDALIQLRKGYDIVQPNDILAAETTAILLSAKRYEEALALSDARIEANAGEALAYNLKGKVYTAMEKFKDARKSFEKAVELAPQWPQAGNDLAALFLLQDQKEKAIAAFEAVLSRNPENPVAYLTLGKLYEEKRDYEKATALYEKGVSAIPGFWRAANRLAFLMADRATTLETLDQALKYATAAYRMQPGQATIVDTLGWIYFKQGETRQALDLYSKLITAAPTDPLVNYHMGVILEKTGDREAARTHLKTATSGDNAFPGREHAEAMLKSMGSKKG